MRTTLFSLALFCLFTSVSCAQEVVTLWGGEDMPYAKENELEEYQDDCGGYTCVYNVTEPTLTIYPAKGENGGKAIIVIPGGGYQVEAILHEGYEVAEALSNEGITAAVLKYRLPNPLSSTLPQMTPLTDLRKALSVMHEHASEFGIREGKVGVMGFSAGSHLATVASLWPSETPQEKPAFSALIYGVTRLDATNKNWLEDTLYYRPLTDKEIVQNTLIAQVNKNTPPTFLVHAMDDDVCHYSESTDYADQLKLHNVSVEMHLFPTGGHGFGLGRSSDGTDQWISLAASWINRQ